MAERTPKTLANLVEPMLHDKLGKTRRRGASPISFKCETTLEAAQLAAELKKRGWSARPTKAINLDNSEVWIGVRVTGLAKKAAVKGGAP
jgi:hypothetical protein